MEWFQSLPLFEQVLYGIAIIGSLFFVIKTIMMFAGFGDDVDVDADVDAADGALDTIDGEGMRFLSLHGIASFFAVGGWAALLGYKGTESPVLSVIIGFVAGVIMMVACAYIMKSMMKLQENANVNVNNAIGKIGEVYLTIPALDQGNGKVNLTMNGSLREYDAISRDKEPISNGVRVRVVDIEQDGTLVVQRESEELV